MIDVTVHRIELVDPTHPQAIRCPQAGSTMKLGELLGSGGSGSVHRVQTDIGPCAVKVLHGLVGPETATVATLARRLSAARPLPEALSALPYAVGSGTIDTPTGQRSIRFHIAVDVSGEVSILQPTAIGAPAATGGNQHRFVRLGDLLVCADLRAKWLALGLRTLCRSAAEFMMAVELLHSVGFVHGDLGAENVLVDPLTGAIRIVDFDTGSFDGNVPVAFGHGDEFVAPEYDDLLNVRDAGLGWMQAERWTCAIVVFHLLAGVHPVGYLEDVAPGRVAAHLERGVWPSSRIEADTSANGRAVAAVVTGVMRRLNHEVTALFAHLMRDGFSDPGKRPPPHVWVAALQFGVHPPQFIEAGFIDPVVATGGPVHLRWNAKGAAAVHVGEQQSHQPANGDALISIDRCASVRLRAVGPGGTAEVSVAAPLGLHRPTFPVLVVATPDLGQLLTQCFDMFDGADDPARPVWTRHRRARNHKGWPQLKTRPLIVRPQ